MKPNAKDFKNYHKKSIIYGGISDKIINFAKL